MSTEKNIEQLLKKLSTDKSPYPKDLLDARRSAYLSQVTSVVSSGLLIKEGSGKGQGGSPPTSAPMTPFMKVVLAALVAANVALASYLAVSMYENWDRLQELLLGGSSVSYPSPISPEFQAPELETTPEVTIPPVETVAPISTPEPTSPSDATSADSQSLSEPEASTPEPDDPGKHLGQTPHGPGDPPGQDNSQDNTKDDGQGNQDDNKDKKEKNNKP